MSSERGPVGEAERGHRRGIVLGFTLAELMLLLLFCLLLVSAGVMIQKDREIEALRASEITKGVTAGELKDLRVAQAQVSALMAALFPGGVPKLTPPQISSLWKELALARQSGALGLSQEQLTELVTVEKALKGLSREQVQAVISQARAGGAMAAAEGQTKWPPIITLGDNGFWFARGSAEITPAFRQQLETNVADRVAALLATYDVDVVEIVGHTDEQPITPSRPSNLDTEAIAAMQGDWPTDQLIPVDNAGLGLARAIAVASVLRGTGKLDGAKFVPMSAAQLVMPGDVLSNGSDASDDEGRRRIEIRVRRTTPSNP